MVTARSEIGRGSNEAALRNDRGSMRARYIIESERWSEMKGQSTFDNIEELFALGLSAVNLGDAARVRVVIDEFRKASAPSQPAELREQAEVMLREMEALDLFAQGRQPRRSRRWIAPPRCRRGCRSRSAVRFR